MASQRSWRARLLNRPFKSEKMECLEQILQTTPSFPGVPLHVCTEDVSREEIDSVRISFQVHIRNTDLIKEQGAPVVPIAAPQEAVDDYSLSLRCGTHLTQGGRKYMEDRIKIVENLQTLKEEGSKLAEPPISYFAVFDGHAGSKAADICTESLHHTIVEQMESRNDYAAILGDSLKALDKRIIEDSTIQEWQDGSCASVVLIKDKNLYAANLGDSHMILVHRDYLSHAIRPIHISEPHKASEEKEKKRITAAGGMVMRGRVFGDLSVSRALGDRTFKKPKQEEDYVSNEAFTKTVELTQHHLFAIIASDGLWDKISFKEAAERVYQDYKSLSAGECAISLLDESRGRGSEDNISVIVIVFDWQKGSKPNPQLPKGIENANEMDASNREGEKQKEENVELQEEEEEAKEEEEAREEKKEEEDEDEEDEDYDESCDSEEKT